MRVDNWPLALSDRIEAWRTIPLVYGSSDCLQFCADIVKAITGEDHLDKFPAYHSRREAAAILLKSGGMRGLVASVLGEEKPASLAQRGDVVVGTGADGQDVAGICLGATWAGPGPKGIEFRPMAAVVAAWTV